jgi:hypothetical protein
MTCAVIDGLQVAAVALVDADVEVVGQKSTTRSLHLARLSTRRSSVALAQLGRDRLPILLIEQLSLGSIRSPADIFSEG